MAKEVEKLAKEVIETVEQNEHIKEVHIAVNGHHYFNVHEHNGDKYARVFVQKIQKDGRKSEIVTPDLKTKIVKTYKREELVGA